MVVTNCFKIIREFTSTREHIKQMEKVLPDFVSHIQEDIDKQQPKPIFEECKQIIMNYQKYGCSRMPSEFDEVTIERQSSDEYVFPKELINQI